MQELSLSMGELFDLMLDAYMKGKKEGSTLAGNILAGSTTPIEPSDPWNSIFGKQNMEAVPETPRYPSKPAKTFRKGRPKGSKNKPKDSVITKGKRNGKN